MTTYLEESSFGVFCCDFGDRVWLEQIDGRPKRRPENVEKLKENVGRQSLLFRVDL